MEFNHECNNSCRLQNYFKIPHLICQVRMKPQLKQTVFRVNGVNQMRQELPVLLVRVRHISTRTGCSGVLFQLPDILF